MWPVSAAVDESLLMPAWRRYTGEFYVTAADALADAVASGAHLVVLSGGYGLVRADEPIGSYNKVLRPADWPNRLLSTLLLDEADRVQAKTIVAFAGATTAYARVLRQASCRATNVERALLVTLRATGGGAMTEGPARAGAGVHRVLAQPAGGYPEDLIVEQLW